MYENDPSSIRQTAKAIVLHRGTDQSFLVEDCKIEDNILSNITICISEFTSVIPLFHTGPESHDLSRIDTHRGQFLQFVGLSDVRLKNFELFKTLATNSPIRNIVLDS